MNHSYRIESARKDVTGGVGVSVGRESTCWTRVLAHPQRVVGRNAALGAFFGRSSEVHGDEVRAFTVALYSSIRRKVAHTADAVLRLFDWISSIPRTFRVSTATRTYSRGLCGDCKEQTREFPADHQEKRGKAKKILDGLDIDLDTDATD